LAFFLGGISGWWVHQTMSVRLPAAPSVSNPPTTSSRPLSNSTIARAPETSIPPPPEVSTSDDWKKDPVAELRRHALRVPIDGATISTMEGSFAEPRAGEPRGHEAVDILAPRNTAVRAVEDGKVAKLFVSKAGGNTIYQFDPSERFCYYYAHLDHYADGLHDGQLIAKGEVIGYVGTTGNAPANTPHLHFAILKLGDDKRWWKGTAIDPFLVFRQ
jgi:peptidoglycan LD-endopeptidase LytH